MNQKHVRWPVVRPALSNFWVHVDNCQQCRQTIVLDDAIGMCAEGVYLLSVMIELFIGEPS